MPTNAAAVPTNPANWCGGGGRLESCYNIESCLKVTGKEGIFMSGNGYCTTGKCCAPDPSKVDITRTPTLAPGSCRPAGFVAQCGSVGCCGGTYESIVSGPLCQCKSMPVNAPTRVAAPPQVPAPTTKPPVAVTTQPPAAPPVGGGGSNPGGGNSQPPAGVACREMTVRMQNSGSDPLVLSKAMKVNEIMDFVCIRPGDASGVLASTQFVVLGPNGYRTVLAGGKATNWKPTVAGAYTVYCEDLTANCTANRSIETGTINVAGSTATATCKECGSEFKCYGHPTAGYKWFTAGYAETGYSLSSDSYCEQDNIAKPNWIGKANGDANCDGRVDVTDVSIWRSEYVESRKNNDPVKSTWESDFTGPDGKCDGKVTVEDRSLWRSVYIKSR